MLRVRDLLAVVGTMALLVATAWATVVEHADVARLTELSDLVVDATVEETTAHLDEESGAIWTVLRLDVRRTFAGEAPDELRVHVPGGTVGELVQDVSGTPHAKRGDRAVLFLWRDGDRYQVLGHAQGCFHVETTDDGRTVCRNDIEGLALVDPDGGAVEAEPIELTVAELRRRVRRAVVSRDEAAARRKAAVEARLEKLREQAEETARRTRGKPGGSQ